MTPEARQRRRIRTPVLAVTVVAWAAMLVPELLGSPHEGASGGTTLAGEAASHGHAGHVGADPSSTGLDASEAVYWSFTPPWGSVTGWGLMLAAMMAPVLIPVLRHAFSRSLPRRRGRAVALVTVAYAATWTAGGVGLVTLAGGVGALTGTPYPAVAAGIAVAVLWQATPWKQRCLNRRARHPPLAAFGRAADVDALRLGGTHAVWCFGSCWALMLVPLLVPEWHLGLMVVATLWVWSEQLERPAVPGWRLRTPVRALQLMRARARSVRERRPSSAAAPA
jgi:predicted metal-binding membrane protein